MATLLHVTPREEDVLRLIADGFTDKEIAARLGLRLRTVRTHLERLYTRHGIHNRAGALTMWFRSQIAVEQTIDVGGNADLWQQISASTVRPGG